MQKSSLLFAAALAAASIASGSFGATVYSTEQAGASAAGNTVSITGIVADVLSATSGSYILEDASGPGGITVGLEVYDVPPASGGTLAVGDTITASGAYSPYKGVPELETAGGVTATSTIVNTTGVVPTADPITAADLTNPASNPNPGQDSIYAITVDELNSVTFGSAAGGTFASPAAGYTVADANNPAVTGVVYLSSSNPLEGTTIPSGPVNIYGYFNEYTNAVEFDPIGANAITAAATPEPASLGLLALAALGLGRRHRSATLRSSTTR